MTLSVAIALTLSIATALVLPMSGIWPRLEKPDLAVRAMFGMSLLLALLLLGAAVAVSAGGVAYLWMAQAVVLFGGMFAVAGIALGLTRRIRSHRRAG
jgi:hypothetical protein